MGRRIPFPGFVPGARTRVMSALVLAAGMTIGIAMSLPPAASAAEGSWWGQPANPGFDRNTVIRATGSVSQVNMAPRRGPCRLSLDTGTEWITVLLAPDWFLDEQRADIRDGDTLEVEGAKMMDRRGRLHLVASQVSNRRTGAVLKLRDETGRPLWGGGRPGRKR